MKTAEHLLKKINDITYLPFHQIRSTPDKKCIICEQKATELMPTLVEDEQNVDMLHMIPVCDTCKPKMIMLFDILK